MPGEISYLEDPGDEAPGTAAIGVVGCAELRVQQRFLGADAGQQRRDKKRGQQHAHAGSEGERPAERIHEQAQIARMADDAVYAVRNQRMPRLDRDQPAEPAAQDKDGPNPQGSAGGKKKDAEPADALAVNRPEPDPVRVGGQIGAQKADNAERRQHPAVGAVLALAGAEISRGEESRCQQREEYNRDCHQRRMGKEGREAARAKNGQTEIDTSGQSLEGHQFRAGLGHGLFPRLECVRKSAKRFSDKTHGKTKI